MFKKRIILSQYIIFLILFGSCSKEDYIVVQICGDEEVIERLNWISIAVFSSLCNCSYEEVYNIEGEEWPLVQSIVISDDMWSSESMILQIKGYQSFPHFEGREGGVTPSIVKTVIVGNSKKVNIELSANCLGFLCDDKMDLSTTTCENGECKGVIEIRDECP